MQEHDPADHNDIEGRYNALFGKSGWKALLTDALELSGRAPVSEALKLRQNGAQAKMLRVSMEFLETTPREKSPDRWKDMAALADKADAKRASF